MSSVISALSQRLNPEPEKHYPSAEPNPCWRMVKPSLPARPFQDALGGVGVCVGMYVMLYYVMLRCVVLLFVGMPACAYVCMLACMHGCMHVSVYVCLDVCM